MVALEQHVADILKTAKKYGASSAETSISTAQGQTVSVRLGHTETVKHHQQKSFAITAYIGKASGSASGSDFSPTGIESVIKAACDIARYTTEDECSGLADAEDMAQQIPDLDLYHPWELGVEEASELALRCEDAALNYDSAITNSQGASVVNSTSESVYGNTHGFIGGLKSSRQRISCSVVAKRDQDMQRNSWFSIARDQNDLESPESIGQAAAKETLKQLSPRQLKTGKIPVILNTDVAEGFFAHVLNAISGGAQYKKASFLLDSLGKQIFPDFISLLEKPHVKKGLGSRAFDSEGVATYDKSIIENGIVTSYLLDSYSARKLGRHTTANAGGIHNLFVSHSDTSLAELLAEMGTGLFVTDTMGMGVNLVTGDYSRGAVGFWVENGEIQYPVQEITIASTLPDMFKGIQKVANDIDQRSQIKTGSVLIDQMTVAGQ